MDEQVRDAVVIFAGCVWPRAYQHTNEPAPTGVPGVVEYETHGK